MSRTVRPTVIVPLLIVNVLRLLGLDYQVISEVIVFVGYLKQALCRCILQRLTSKMKNEMSFTFFTRELTLNGPDTFHETTCMHILGEPAVSIPASA